MFGSILQKMEMITMKNIILFWELQEAQNEYLSTDLVSQSLWTISQRNGFPEQVTCHLKELTPQVIS